MSRPDLYLCAGARPNFVKLAPLARALSARGDLPFTIVHTGQHQAPALSESFFRLLAIDGPTVPLGTPTDGDGGSIATIRERFDALLRQRPPAAVVVLGDVNGTLACAEAAAARGIPLAHVEAGLRSFDPAMPEERNRIAIDALCDLLLVSEPSGVTNLRAEGRPEAAIQLVGNLMIDSLRAAEPLITTLEPWRALGLEPRGYGLVTLHRPANVDDPGVLRALMDCLGEIARTLPLVFPVHPRTADRLGALSFSPHPALHAIEPATYLESLAWQCGSRVVLTDSGGIQEEAACLDVPCLTLRWNTERPITVERGTNTLVGNDPARILAAFREVTAGRVKRAAPIPLWDGRAAPRAADALASWLRRSG